MLLGVVGTLNKQSSYAMGMEITSDKKLSLLFKNLSTVESSGDAEIIVKDIWNFWINDTAKIKNRKILQNGIDLMNSQNFQEAESVFSVLIQDDPDYTEAWNKRATVRYVMGNYDGSFEDVNMVLAKQPKHFGALSGLGLLLIQSNDFKGALSAYKRVLAINPFSPDALNLIPILIRKIYGDSL